MLTLQPDGGCALQAPAGNASLGMSRAQAQTCTGSSEFKPGQAAWSKANTGGVGVESRGWGTEIKRGDWELKREPDGSFWRLQWANKTHPYPWRG